MKKNLALAGVLALVTSTAMADHHGEERGEERKRHHKFEMVDTNSDGFVSRDEMFEAHRNRVDDMFERADGDQDGKLSKDEMKAAKKKLRSRMQERWNSHNQPDEE
jgi:Ca2+-binding EF-hand superfamily protein